MVRYTEEAKLANNGLVELSEECQLAVNGGCTSNSGVTLDDVAHEFLKAIDRRNYGYHLHPCPYCD